MKRKSLHKILCSTVSLLTCALLIDNTISVPVYTDDEGTDIVIEIPECVPMNDEESIGELDH